MADDWQDLPTKSAQDDWQDLPKKPDISEPESALIGGGQALTLDFGDELVGAGKAAYDKLRGNPEPYTSLYRKHQKSAEDYAKEAERQNPHSYMAGKIAGGAASLAVPGLDLLAPAKELGAAANVGRAALGGVIDAAGSSEYHPFEDPNQAKKFGAQLATGGIIGGAAGGLGETAKGLSNVSPEYLRSISEPFSLSNFVKPGGGVTKSIVKGIVAPMAANTMESFPRVGQALIGGGVNALSNPAVETGLARGAQEYVMPQHKRYSEEERKAKHEAIMRMINQ